MFLYLSLIEDEEEKNKFVHIYQAYRNLMLYIAYQILGNQQDAEDAVHEACLSIIGILEKISNPVCPKTRSLIGIVVRRKAIDLYRARKRRVSEPLEEWNAPEQGASPENMTEFSDAFSQALNGLTQRQRDLLLLKYDQGFEMREIAIILGMTEVNASKSLQRAKEKLRKTLKEQGVEA